MKKLIIVMLVAILASGFAFAALTGFVNIQFKGNFDNKEVGFANGTYAKLSFKYTSDPINIKGEEEIHVELAVSGSVNVIDSEKTGNPGTTNLPFVDPLQYTVKFDTAKIVGTNWWVSILYPAGPEDYAKASLLGDGDGPATYTASYSAARGGLMVSYAYYVGSFGFWMDNNGIDISGTIKTPEFKFADGAVTLTVAAGGGKKPKKSAAAGVSAKSTVKVQDVTLDIAGDFGIENITEKFDALKFAGDASVKGSYNDFVSASMYVFGASAGVSMKHDTYGYKKLYLEAQASVNLNTFDVPVTVGVSAQNIVDVSDKPTIIGAEAEYSKDAITAGVAGYVKINGGFAGWGANAYGQYKTEKFTAGASVGVSGPKGVEKLSAGVYATTDALVNGATFGVSYGYKSVAANLGMAKDTSKFGNNFLGGDAQYGTAGVYCQINF